MNFTEGSDTHQLWERILIVLIFLKQRYAALNYVIYNIHTGCLHEISYEAMNKSKPDKKY